MIYIQGNLEFFSALWVWPPWMAHYLWHSLRDVHVARLSSATLDQPKLGTSCKWMGLFILYHCDGDEPLALLEIGNYSVGDFCTSQYHSLLPGFIWSISRQDLGVWVVACPRLGGAAQSVLVFRDDATFTISRYKLMRATEIIEHTSIILHPLSFDYEWSL